MKNTKKERERIQPYIEREKEKRDERDWAKRREKFFSYLAIQTVTINSKYSN